ncbi:phage/plasmid primase, P4 family, partial [Selenomonas ruminantium]
KLNEFIYEQELGRKVSPVKQAPADSQNGNELSADEIIERIRWSKQWEKFSKLYYNGDKSDYGDNWSSADNALINILYFWTGNNKALTEEMFYNSALAQRDKALVRPDYVPRTIEKIIETWNGGKYDPKAYAEQQRQQDLEELCREKGITVDCSPLLDFGLTDTGNAERLKYLYGENILYIEENNRWYTWTGKKWQQEDGKEGLSLYDKTTTVARLSYAKAKEQYDQTPATSKEETARRVKVLNYFKKLENMQLTKNCITRARSLCLGKMEQMDKDPFLLNCGNGTVDLKTGELKPHSREDHITMITRADYVPGAKHELWEKVLQSAIPDDETRRWLKRFIGYSLYGLTDEEKFLFLYGPGGGGKGTFIESIGHVLGDYCGTMDIDTILTARNDAGNGGQATPQLAILAGKRLILTSESGAGRKFNAARLKLITGGDKITARFLHGNPFTFSPQFTLVMSSNYKPAITDTTDEGMRRRLMMVPFTAVFEEKDVMLKRELKECKECREAILAWCIEGAQEWIINGLGELPENIVKAMGAYYAENDILGLFIEECCEVGKDKHVGVKAFCKAFNDWLRESQQKTVTLRTLSGQMENRGYTKARYDNTCFTGIKLNRRTEFEEP